MKKSPPTRSYRKEKLVMRNLFKFNSEEEFEIRNENLSENIEEKDEMLIDNNNIETNLDEAILFF